MDRKITSYKKYMDDSKFDQFKDPLALSKTEAKAEPEAEDLDASLEQLIKQRRDHYDRTCQENEHSELLVIRGQREAELSKTARKSVELLKKKQSAAEEALLIDFTVGGCGYLEAGGLRSIQGTVLGTVELLTSFNQIVAVRVSDNPMANVFLVSSDPSVEEYAKILGAQLKLFMKAYVIVPPTVFQDLVLGRHQSRPF